MTIKLRPETIKALEPELVRFIEQSTVLHGNSVDVVSSFRVLWDAEELLPKDGPTRQQLNQIIGERGLTTFMADELRAKFAVRHYEENKPREPVVKALGLEDPRPLAQELLQAFQKLPRSYSATLPLPPKLTEFVKRLDPIRPFGPYVRFLHDPEEMKRIAPRNSLGDLMANALLFGGRTTSTDVQSALEIRVDGFVPRFGATETTEEAHSLFKSFFGLGLAIGLLKPADYPQPQTHRLGIQYHLTDEQAERPLATALLTDAETTAVFGLSYAARSNRDRADLSDAERKMADMDIILSVPEKHQLLLRACRWLFDSYVSEDPLLSFVQATVVLEIVLGEKASSDEVGLSTLLANRCAYMIGASTSERTAIIKNFKALYATRSQIVHSGKHRLSASEKMQLHQLRALGRRVLCAEIVLAIEEIRREEQRSATQATAKKVDDALSAAIGSGKDRR